MSTTFDIYPSDSKIPSFKDVLHEVTSEYHTFLSDVGLKYKPEIEIRILTKSGDKEIGYSHADSFKWSDDHYLWAQIKGIAGGTDGYFWENDKNDYDYWKDDVIPLERCSHIRGQLERCLSVGFHWNLRRSAGQPGVINIFYGILAGVLAQITDGVVFSDDSAWDYGRMPIRGKDFLKSYYRPDRELSAEIRGAAISSIRYAKEELENLNA